MKQIFNAIRAKWVEVAPFTGAWIETRKRIKRANDENESHPSRVRGLKRANHRGLKILINVAPFTGAWIETRL